MAGPDKAAYGYPSEHYQYWRERLRENALPWGAFGENFTTEGLFETEISIGDRFRAGSAIVMVKTPRLPCLKLAAKFRRDEMIEDFVNSERCGFYFSVEEEGEVVAGDEFRLLGGETPTLTIAEANRLYLPVSFDPGLLQRATEVKSLPEGWRERYRSKLDAIQKQSLISREQD